jgi:hypothetical protein
MKDLTLRELKLLILQRGLNDFPRRVLEKQRIAVTDPIR